ncbi:hypothetical protein [Bradyrhizobium japonicum]|uniref:hypothetical protein n=1 Tax=Bradyrhizobium japonicum TaxID=375 RepID=UPI001BA4CCE1|nr:hypothetical protein [Bradyrhizobium japonicum]MBR0962199.1 hypothetical protein [Bradyrhizobium japonicum]
MNKPITETAAIDEGWEWAIVEILGHRRHVGRAREEEKFGGKMLRIDVPKLGGREHYSLSDGEVTWSTHFYGVGSIFSYTLTDEKTVMRYAERYFVPAIPYRDHGPVEDDQPVTSEEEPTHDDEGFDENARDE